MKSQGSANPHKEFSREWIEWEDGQWRQLMKSGAVDHCANRIRKDYQEIGEGKQSSGRR